MRLLLVLILIALPAPLVAQDLFVPANGPFGGTITDMTLAGDGALVAGTDNGIYRSTDMGDTWMRTSDGLPITAILTLLRTPTGTLVAGSVDAGTYRSVDNGRSWTKVNTTSQSSYVWAIAQRPSDSLIVISTSDDAYVSRDDGLTWEGLGLGLGPYGVAVDSNGAVLVFVDGHLLRSATPESGSWDTLTISSTGAVAMQLCVAADGSLIAVTDEDGFHRSTDRGASWERLLLDSSLITSHSAYRANDSTIFITSDAGAIYTSTDNGATWEEFATGFQVVYNVRVVQQGDTALVYALTSDGIHVSADRGGTWSNRSVGIEAMFVSTLSTRQSDGRVFAGTHNGLVFSTPGNGAPWIRLPLDRPYTTSIATVLFPRPATLVVAGYGEGVFVSTDDGLTWESRSTGVERRPLNAGIVTGTGSIILASDSGRIYRSTDVGGAWEETRIDSTTLVLSLARDSIGRVWAATSSSLYVSSDDGATWVRSGQGITASYVGAVATGPDGTLYAGAFNGNFFRSIDSGATWIRSTLDPTGILVVALLADPNGTLFAGLINRAVMRSSDHGVTWTPYRTGITSYSTYALTLDSAGHLYAGTAGSGAFRSVDRSSSVPSDRLADPADVLTVIPSIARNGATLHTWFAKPTDVRIDLVSLSGRIATSLDLGMVDAGGAEFALPVDDLHSGTWLVRLIGDGHVRSALFRIVR